MNAGHIEARDETASAVVVEGDGFDDGFDGTCTRVKRLRSGTVAVEDKARTAAILTLWHTMHQSTSNENTHCIGRIVGAGSGTFYH